LLHAATEAETAVATGKISADVAAEAASDAVAVAADAAAAAAAVFAPAADTTFLHPSTLRRKVKTVAATAGEIAAAIVVDEADIQTAAATIADRVVTLIAARIPHAPPLLPIPRKSRLCCRVNRWRNIAGARYPRLLLR
jgi:hypothetical protein